MNTSLGRRIFLAHLELSYRLGRKITLAEFGEMTAREMNRETPFTAASVSRWESGAQVPVISIIEAIGTLTGTDPGWISHGSRSAAPPPRRLADSRAGDDPDAPTPRPVKAGRRPARGGSVDPLGPRDLPTSTRRT
jgi:transcriptional regulator with XRE-family HTH domain